MSKDQIDDGLTDEERASLDLEDDNTFAGMTVEQAEAGAKVVVQEEGNSDEGDGNAEKDTGAGDDGNDRESGDVSRTDGSDAAKPAESDKPAADSSAEPEGKESTPQASIPTPVLVAKDIADAEAKLAEIGTKKEELLTKFDDGDITVREYQKELDALSRQEREIERAKDRAELAKEMNDQQATNTWNVTVATFLAQNDQYNPETSPDLYQLLDTKVRRIAVSDEFKNRSDASAGAEILKKAHAEIEAMLGRKPGETTKPTEQKSASKKPDLPPSLHRLPASEAQEVTNSKYAALDALFDRDPIAYEDALDKMSDAERAAYLKAK